MKPIKRAAITLHSKLELGREKAKIYEIPVTFPSLDEIRVPNLMDYAHYFEFRILIASKTDWNLCVSMQICIVMHYYVLCHSQVFYINPSRIFFGKTTVRALRFASIHLLLDYLSKVYIFFIKRVCFRNSFINVLLSIE